VYQDIHEDNDSFEKATSMYEVGQYESGIYKLTTWVDATISQKTSGWWLWKKTYIDKDFYSFDCCVTGTLKVMLTNVPSNCDYDLRAYKLKDGPDAKASSLRFKEDCWFSSEMGKGSDEELEFSVTPRTYYFCVNAFQDKTFDNDHPYHLQVEESEDVSHRENIACQIPLRRHSGDLGALWVSDYKPLGYTPVTLTGTHSVIDVRNYDDYPFIRHLADKYTDGNYINYAVLYVWDLSTRACLSAIAQQLIQEINQKTDWNDTESKEVSVGMNTAGLVLTVAGIAVAVISTASLGPVAAATLAVLGIEINAAALTLSLSSFAMAFNTNAPYLSTRKDLLSYLVSMQQTFAIGKGSSDKEVKILRCRYRFDSGTHALNWSPFYSELDNNFYNEDNILFQIDHSGINGTIRSFRSLDEIRTFLGA